MTRPLIRDVPEDSVWRLPRAHTVRVEAAGIAGRDIESQHYKDGVAFVRYCVMSASDAWAGEIGKTDEMMLSAFVEAYKRIDDEEVRA